MPSLGASSAAQRAPFVEFPKEATEGSIIARFERQAASYPDRLAVRGERRQFSYGQLNQAANHIARIILRRRGGGAERVALLIDHDASLIAALLGVLKAGKAYLPLDPSHPRARMASILEDAQAGLLLTDDANLLMAESLRGSALRLINLSDIDPRPAADSPGVAIPADAMAYLLYTSGSTGQPKGAGQTHRSALHATLRYTNALRFRGDDRMALLTACAYSLSKSMIFGALLNGAALMMFDVKKRGVAGLADWLIGEEVTVYHSVPTLFRHFARTLSGGVRFPRLRWLHFSGEPLYARDIALAKEHVPPTCRFANELGTTETHVYRLYIADVQTERADGAVPAGYPVEDTEILLLDEAGREVGPGGSGEIAVKSRYLSPGYWRRPELTRAVFQPAPGGGGKRIYRTGDLGRMRPDGCLEHLGRKDFQVKVRGHRIELAEIELTLLEHSAVEEAVVQAWQDEAGDQRLAAYIVPAGGALPTVGELRRFLLRKLPEPMVPAAFVPLEALPLTPNNKVDRRALPAPSRSRLALESGYLAPRDEIERRLAGIWEELLEVRPVGVRDGFRELGGDSLLVVGMLAEIERVFGKAIPVSGLTEAATIEHLARTIRGQPSVTSWSPIVAIQRQGSRPPFYCVHAVLGDVLCYRGLAGHLGQDQPFYGLRARGLEAGQEPFTDLEAMAAYYVQELRSFQPAGPYFLGGWSLGGSVAFEMARRLRAVEQEVGLLALFDHARGDAKYPPQWDLSRLTDKMRRVIAAHNRGLRAYVPGVYPDRLSLFRAAVQPPGRARAPDLGWSELAAGGVEVIEVPGDHLRMTREPHVRVLAERLRACLDRAQVGRAVTD